MRRLKKLLLSMTVLLGIGLSALAIVISYDAACPTPSSAAASAPLTISAYRYGCYGSPAVLTLANVAKPAPSDSQVLVKVHAVSVNPLDWHYLRGKPYVMRLSSGIGAPSNTAIGADFSGTVEAVGSRVTRFKVGDRVFGIQTGAFAEYVVVSELGTMAIMPDSVSFEQASAVGVAAITALQAVRDHGHVAAGQRVLINGASGGVGTFAVQIAKSYSAHVTGVASTRNLAMITGLGADSVIDYTKDDFTKGAQRFDVIIDMVSNHPVRTLARMLTPTGRTVIVGGTSDNRWLGPGAQSLRAILLSPFLSNTFVTMLASDNAKDLKVLGALMQSGKLTTAIDRRYPFSELPAAVEYLEKGRARGKVVVTVVP